MNIDEARNAKGEYGEQVVRKLLDQWGYTVYEPQHDKSERCDIIAMRPTRDLVMVEVKTKELSKYGGTGFDIKYRDRYKEIVDNPKNPEFRIVFVDAEAGEIYGATFNHMYGKEQIHGTTCFWDRAIFSKLATLSNKDIKAILNFKTV